MVARFGYRTVMTTGLLIVTGALFALTRLQLDTPPWALIVAFFAFGFGMGNVIAPASTVMQNVLPLDRVGAGSAVQNTVRQVFGAFGVAVIGTILATRYAAEAASALAPLPVDAKATASTSVQLTQLVLQHAEAAGAPASVVDQIRAGAFDAFLTATHFANLISTAVILLAAAVVFFWLPKITPPSKQPAAPTAPEGETLVVPDAPTSVAPAAPGTPDAP
jgi:MFS family permease